MKTLLTITALLTMIGVPAPPSRPCTPSWKSVDAPAYRGGATSVSAVSAREAWFTASESGSRIPEPRVLRWGGGGRIAESRVQVVFPPYADGLSRDYQYASLSLDSATSGWAWTYENSLVTGSWLPLLARWRAGRWTLTPTAVPPDPERAGLRLLPVVSLAANDAWAAGYFYQADKDTPAGLVSVGALIEHWDGTQWQVADNPAGQRPGAWLLGLTALSATDIWAVGVHPDTTGTTVPLTLHFDGKTWSEVPAPAFPARTVLYDVGGSGPRDVWAVGLRTDPNTGKTAGLAMHWDGKRWRVATGLPGGAESLNQVYAPAADDVWVLGHPEGFLHWDGTRWEIVRPPGPPKAGLNKLADIDGTGPNDIWAVGTGRHSGRDKPLILHRSCGRS